MLTEGFKNWFIDYVGKNYGYNVETSTEWQLTEEEINTLYKKLYKEYGIDNIYLSSYYCKTCEEHHGDKKYHLDYEELLDLTKEEVLKTINREHWSENDIQEEIDKINKIKEVVKNIKKKENAVLKREAYVFYNDFKRTVRGEIGNYNFVLVEKEFFNKVYNLEEEEINQYIDKWIARIDVVEEWSEEKKYILYEI